MTATRRSAATNAAQTGFTIVELMIATAVLSTLLLLTTVIISSIGNLYFKAISESKIQDDSRDVINQVGQDLELNEGFGTTGSLGGTQAFCIGGVRYTYVIGKELGTASGQSPHVLWRDANPNPSSCTAVSRFPNPTTSGSELMPARSRLIKFTITGTPPSGNSPYTITLSVAYGDDDLLCSPSVANSCTTPNAMTPASDYTKGDLLCKSLTVSSLGDSFCGTSILTTTVEQRITQN